MVENVNLLPILQHACRDFSRRGGKGGILCPSENGLPPELCLDDETDFNMIEILPPSIFKRLDLPSLNLFSRKIPACVYNHMLQVYDSLSICFLPCIY